MGLGLGFLSAFPGAASGADRPQGEVQSAADIKANFLVNFARCVDWPATAFPQGNEELLVGFVGPTMVKQAAQAFEGQTIKGHRIKLVQTQDWQELAHCHVLYFSEVDRLEINRTLKLLRGRQVLTIGETEDFLKAGGMVRFAEDRNRVKIFVNRKASQDSNLPISSRLLSIVTMVDP